jgi:hypothetical protein
VRACVCVCVCVSGCVCCLIPESKCMEEGCVVSQCSAEISLSNLHTYNKTYT